MLILDEPAQNLDISGQINFYKLLQSIYKKRNLSILMVSHDLHLVMVSTKKVLCLYNHICCSGEPHQIAKDPEFISMFWKRYGKYDVSLSNILIIIIMIMTMIMIL